MQKVAALSPATYALRGMRAAILNGANSNQLFQEIKPLLFLGVILLPAGIVVFNYVEKYAKKKGLLKRSG